MVQTFNGKKVVGSVDFELAFCEELFSTMYYQCFGDNHIMRSDPLLSFYFTELVRRLQDLAHAHDCADYSIVLLEPFSE